MATQISEGDLWAECVRCTIRRPDPRLLANNKVPVVAGALDELNVEIDRASPVNFKYVPIYRRHQMPHNTVPDTSAYEELARSHLAKEGRRLYRKSPLRGSKSTPVLSPAGKAAREVLASSAAPPASLRSAGPQGAAPEVPAAAVAPAGSSAATAGGAAAVSSASSSSVAVAGDPRQRSLAAQRSHRSTSSLMDSINDSLDDLIDGPRSSAKKSKKQKKKKKKRRDDDAGRSVGAAGVGAAAQSQAQLAGQTASGRGQQQQQQQQQHSSRAMGSAVATPAPPVEDALETAVLASEEEKKPRKKINAAQVDHITALWKPMPSAAATPKATAESSWYFDDNTKEELMSRHPDALRRRNGDTEFNEQIFVWKRLGMVGR